MTELLPTFPYHPDPVATGVIAASSSACICCGRERGRVYTGPVYATEALEGRLCPWCIADGSAADRFDAHFTAGTGLGDDDVPAGIFAAVDRRTPGFRAWQEPQWYFHCGDGAAFVGSAGADELTAFPEALDTLRREAIGWGWPSNQVEHFLGSLDKDGERRAHLFRCRVCATHLAYSDFA
ncbi:CbrC family protein [Streptomyces sp. KL116D]|uniref:CbrC family protein n=1 Tax=Streptomyces sp. KL116D TaxID=3045152 RepID=UPI00355843C8